MEVSINCFNPHAVVRGISKQSAMSEIQEFLADMFGDDTQYGFLVNDRENDDIEIHINILLVTTKAERHSILTWLINNKLWKIKNLTALAFWIPSELNVDIIAEEYLFDADKDHIIQCNAMQEETLRWVADQCSDCEDKWSMQTIADTAWHAQVTQPKAQHYFICTQ